MAAMWLIVPSFGFSQEVTDQPSAFLVEVPLLGNGPTNRETIPPSPDAVSGTSSSETKFGPLDKIGLSNSGADASTVPGSLTADLIKRLAETLA